MNKESIEIVCQRFIQSLKTITQNICDWIKPRFTVALKNIQISSYKKNKTQSESKKENSKPKKQTKHTDTNSLIEKWRKKLENYLKDSWINLPFQVWGNARDVIISIILASFLVNILSLAFPLTLLQVYDRIIPNEAITTLVILCSGVLIAILLSASMRVARSYISSWADAKFEHILGCRAFKSLLCSSLVNYEKEGSGRHLKRIGALNQLRNFFAGQAVIAIIDLPFIFIFLALIAYIGLWLVFIPALIIVVFAYSTWKNSSDMVKVLRNRQDHDDKRLNFIVETLSKIHTIKSNTMEAQMLRRYERLQKASSLFDYRVTQNSSNMLSDSMTLSQLTIAMVVGFGSVMVFNGTLTVGSLAACTLLSGRCLQPVNTLINLWSRLQLIKISREEFKKVMHMKAESKSGLPKVEEVQGEIIFDNVSFKYSESTSYILREFNLKIPKHSSISISGEGLSGKSSIMWLILGMIKPTDGQVLLDGVDISEIERNSLRKQIGYMPQNAALFQGTVLENITMFDEDLIDAAFEVSETVGLDEIIKNFPEGYDLKVGYQATDSIAVGIKQRIAIARALVRKPPIILFDEANIALDMKGDTKVRELLTNMLGKHTIIIASHRPSILALAKKHYILKHGCLRLVS